MKVFLLFSKGRDEEREREREREEKANLKVLYPFFTLGSKLIFWEKEEIFKRVMKFND